MGRKSAKKSGGVTSVSSKPQKPLVGSISVNDPFASEHRPLLALITLAALECVESRAAESVLDVLLAPSVVSSSNTPANSKANRAVRDNNNNGDDSKPMVCSLTDSYPEVRVLYVVHNIRCCLRDLQECPKHARSSFLRRACSDLRTLYAILPDPLFEALAQVTEKLVLQSEEGEKETAISTEVTHVLEVQVLYVIEELQRELLTQTRRLTERAATLTVHYRHNIPFCR